MAARSAATTLFYPFKALKGALFFQKTTSKNQNKFNKTKLTLRNYDIRQSF
jgi:hypothetical protein